MHATVYLCFSPPLYLNRLQFVPLVSFLFQDLLEVFTSDDLLHSLEDLVATTGQLYHC